jgi:hypothetical protein
LNVDLILTGGAQLLFGVASASVALTTSTRAAGVLLKLPPLSSHPSVPTSVGIVYGATCLATGWVIKGAVSTPFEALQLVAAQGLGLVPLLKCAAYGVCHVAFSTLIGVLCLLGGVFAFDRITQGVDEVDAVRRGEIAPACVLACVVLVLALLVAPGLELLLQGTLPIPNLQGDGLRTFR